MVRVFLFGRVGHQLFQYAVGRHLAIKNNTSLLLYPAEVPDSKGNQKNILSRFQINAQYVNSTWSKIIKETGIWKVTHRNIYWEKGHSFDPKVLYCNRNCTLRGNFQSDKYFWEISDQLRKELTMNDLGNNEQMLELLAKIKNSNSVSINVRRGDYVGENRYDIINLDYYRNSIKFIKKKISNPVFYVFSDDISWCKRNLEGENFIFSDANDKQFDPLNDMYLMKHCEHNIITNSAYSWWSAWLNHNPNKLVISPYKWFNASDVPIEDKLCNGWIPIEF